MFSGFSSPLLEERKARIRKAAVPDATATYCGWQFRAILFLVIRRNFPEENA
jgi:hypothetical protein